VNVVGKRERSVKAGKNLDEEFFVASMRMSEEI
jgi:hypothetical protein